MKLNTISCIFFSPTGTTIEILDSICSGIKGTGTVFIDLTYPLSGTGRFVNIESQLAVIGVPVYGGRVPNTAVERLRKIRGNNTPAVITLVFGNREYEDALLELQNCAKEVGFIPIAAAAFIGEHSFSSDPVPLAAGRPDPMDIEKAVQFGKLVRKKLEQTASHEWIPDLQIPGKYPYRDWVSPSGIAPSTGSVHSVQCLR